MKSAFSPACSKAVPPELPLDWSSRTQISAQRTTEGLQSSSGQPTPTIPISRNTAFATIAGVDVRQRARLRCVSRLAPLPKKYLFERYGVQIRGYMSQLGPIRIEDFDWDEVDRNPFFCPDAAKVPEMEAYMAALNKEGNSIGARINVVASGVPVGLGEPVFDRLDADLAHALMSINAVKGVEIGAGFSCITQKGTEHRDEMSPQGFFSNNAGGILGGISSGQDILASIALKPTSSIRIPGRSIDVHGNPVDIITTGRHDPCVGIRATPIAEAMMAIVLMDHLLRHRAQNADVVSTTPIL